MPAARMLAPIAAAISRTRSGSNEAPHASGVGKAVAVQAAKPVRHSSWAIAGMPNRLLLMILCLQPGQFRDAFGRLQRAGAEHPGEVAESVPDQLPQRRHVRGELALQRRDAVAIGGGAAQPDAAQLRESSPPGSSGPAGR